MDRGSILLRRYLCRRLSEYYAQPADKVVGSVGVGIGTGSFIRQGISFSSLINEWHWKYTYKRIYNEQRGMWLTPVEIFYPYYSNILANFVNESMTTTTSLTNLSNAHHDKEGAFEIVELGGGRGTNAIALLNHLSECHPKSYERLQCYTIFDTSKTLHEYQTTVLKQSQHAEKVKLVNTDMIDIAEGKSMFLTPSDTPTAVIAMELLDNLPHDKIGRCIETGDILQAIVVPSDDATSNILADNVIDTSIRYNEQFAPMNDPLLQNILSIAPSLYTPNIRPRWVPTVAIGILMKLFECRPNFSVALADFDWLPPSDSSTWTAAQSAVAAADGDPLVTDMEGNDHECYLTSPPNALCDILFPTDFGRLANFVDQYMAQPTIAHPSSYTTLTMKQRDFLSRYGPAEVEKTKVWTGYSPMINDFGNCSVLVTTQG